MSTRPQATRVVLIPALLYDEQLDCDMITVLGDTIERHVLLSPKPKLEDSVADILRRAPARTDYADARAVGRPGRAGSPGCG